MVGPAIGHDQFVVQGFEWGPAQARAGLRDARLPGDLGRGGGPGQPLHAFEQTPQHLAIRDLHVEREGDHVIDDDMRGQLALTPACLPRSKEERAVVLVSGHMLNQIGVLLKIVRFSFARDPENTVEAHASSI